MGLSPEKKGKPHHCVLIGLCQQIDHMDYLVEDSARTAIDNLQKEEMTR